MTTAQEIYEAAISLLDRRSQSDQTADNDENADYKARTLDILNGLRFECAAASYNYNTRKGNRNVDKITDFDKPILGIDDAVAQEAMPFGLAYHLVLQEDPTTADYLRLKYEESLAIFKREIPAEFEPIGSPYGGNEWGEFARW